MLPSFRGSVALAGTLIAASGVFAQVTPSEGPDVILSEGFNVVHVSPVGGVHGYAFGSNTCNIGNQNLPWISGGSPGMVMNAYRVENGRIEQIGMSWSKVACCAEASNFCGLSCNGVHGTALGAGCRDTYSGAWNGEQNSLRRRSNINAFAATFTFTAGSWSGNLDRRIQIAQADMDVATHPTGQFFFEGVYICAADMPFANEYNNCSYFRATRDASYALPAVAGSTRAGTPAIQAWRDHGLGPNQPDTSVTILPWDVPAEGRYYIGCRTAQVAADSWRYEIAVFNFNSDRAGASFAIPLCDGAIASSPSFHDINYHSGEVYDNTDWSVAITPTEIRWSSPQTFAQNPNSNALRFGTLYNFGFTCNRPPAPAGVGGRGEPAISLGLFKPGTPSAISLSTLPIIPGCPPINPCPADWNESGTLDSSDFFAFLDEFFASGADYDHSGGTDSSDFFAYLADFLAGCA